MLTYCNYFVYLLTTSTRQLWNDLKRTVFLKPLYDIEAAKYVDLPLELHDTEFIKEE
jgi:hypothetical protein